MDSEQLNINRDRHIDLLNLHYEWVLLVELSDRYSVEAVQARRNLEQAKEKERVEKSKAVKRAFDTVKSPVDKVKAEAETDEDYLKTVQQRIEAAYNRDLIESALSTIETKRFALHEILKLEMQGFWNQQSIEPKGYEEWRGKRFSDEAREKRREMANERSRAAVRQRLERSQE